MRLGVTQATSVAAVFCLSVAAGLAGEGSVLSGEGSRDPSSWVLVQFRPEVARTVAGLSAVDALERVGVELGLPPGGRLREPGVGAVLRSSRQARLGRPAPEPAVDWHRFLYLDLPPRISAAEVVGLLRGHPLVDYVERDGLVKLHLIPCDAGFQGQWWLVGGAYEMTYEETEGWPSIHAREAWDITTGSSNVVVGIIDSGIDSRIIEFAGRVVPGWNVVDGNSDTMDLRGHGTSMAGLLGANANNPPPWRLQLCGYGGVGVDWRCSLMPVKAINFGQTMLASSAAEGIDYAVANGCKVINLSWGLENEDGAITITRSVSNAIASRVIVVCSAGDSGNPISQYPAKYDPVIAVGGSSPNGRWHHELWTYGSYGPEMELMAPATRLWSLVPDQGSPEHGGESGAGGSSAAAALVSGVCSLLASVRPDITHEQARMLLCAGADDEGQRGFDIETGWGQLNAYDTLLLATTRIDGIAALPGGQLEMSWRSPSDAAERVLYQLEFAPALGEAWTPITTGSMRHEPTRTFWTGAAPSGPGAFGYFRVRVELRT
jgi:subtilisin family serine protease